MLQHSCVTRVAQYAERFRDFPPPSLLSYVPPPPVLAPIRYAQLIVQEQSIFTGRSLHNIFVLTAQARAEV
jgi:hypothetical protein